jgi:uncharacterized RDD family membrane protein YckC
MTTDHQNQIRFLSRRYVSPIGSALIIALLAIGVFLSLFHRTPVPKLPPPVFQLKAAGVGNQLDLFWVRRDSPSAPSKETSWLQPIEGGRPQQESEIKSFDSVTTFENKLWFFSPGMYRIFDGKEWLRFDAPWVGENPIAAAVPGGLWLLSRVEGDLSLTSYSRGGWDRPVAVPTDSGDRNLLCSERCPSNLIVFKQKIHYFWLKGGSLYQLIFGNGISDRAESLGKMKGFGALSEPDRILLWYFPSLSSAHDGAASGTIPVGLKVFDGTGWREQPGLDRRAPIGLLEIAPVRFQEKTHLLINTGIQIEDKVWDSSGPGRSVYLKGGDVGKAGLRYQEWVLVQLIVITTIAAAAMSFVLHRLKSASGDPNISYASVWRRFVAKAIDTALFVVPIGILIGSRLDTGSVVDPTSFVHILSAGGGAVMILPLMIFVYHVLSEGLWGQTLGKRLCGIAVMDQYMQPCTMFQSVIRNILRWVDGIGLYGVGVIAVAATDRWQRLGDLAGRTIVVRTKP